MTDGNNNAKGRGGASDTRLAAVLAAYGRNPLRWPEADRVRFAGLLRKPELLPENLTAEADALDKLLDTATATSIAEPEGARDRLLAAINAAPEVTEPVAPHGHETVWRSGFLPQRLLVAGTLAASVMLGVFVGIGTEAGGFLAESLQLPGTSDDVLDVVLVEDSDDEGLL